MAPRNKSNTLDGKLCLLRECLCGRLARGAVTDSCQATITEPYYMYHISTLETCGRTLTFSFLVRRCKPKRKGVSPWTGQRARASAASNSDVCCELRVGCVVVPESDFEWRALPTRPTQRLAFPSLWPSTASHVFCPLPRSFKQPHVYPVCLKYPLRTAKKQSLHCWHRRRRGRRKISGKVQGVEAKSKGNRVGQ